MSRGRVPRYGVQSRRGLRLEGLLGEAERHTVATRSPYSEDDEHCTGRSSFGTAQILLNVGFGASSYSAVVNLTGSVAPLEIRAGSSRYSRILVGGQGGQREEQDDEQDQNIHQKSASEELPLVPVHGFLRAPVKPAS